MEDHVVELKSTGPTRFTGAILDTYIAPGVSDFTDADIPDMSNHHAESDHWIDNHFLNSVFRSSFSGAMGAYAANILRRVSGAFEEHARARTATRAFLASSRQSPSQYSSALMHWEYFLTQSWQAHELLRRMIATMSDTEDFRFFEKNDGSLTQRLYNVAGAMRHTEKAIASGRVIQDSRSPVWLTNEGIESEVGQLTYSETAEILDHLAGWADLLVDPAEMREKAIAEARGA